MLKLEKDYLDECCRTHKPALIYTNIYTNVYLYQDNNAFCSMYYFSYYYLQGLEFIQQNGEDIFSVKLCKCHINSVPSTAVTRREGNVLSFCGFFICLYIKKLLKHTGSQSPFGDHSQNWI